MKLTLLVHNIVAGVSRRPTSQLITKTLFPYVNKFFKKPDKEVVIRKVPKNRVIGSLTVIMRMLLGSLPKKCNYHVYQAVAL